MERFFAPGCPDVWVWRRQSRLRRRCRNHEPRQVDQERGRQEEEVIDRDDDCCCSGGGSRLEPRAVVELSSHNMESVSGGGKSDRRSSLAGRRPQTNKRRRWWLMLVAAAMLLTSAIVAGDNRCFLDGGGSTETFFVKESLPVGSLIGGLRVIGEPDVDVRISLVGGGGLPVALEPGTKDLVLRRELDKEEVKGPSAVAFSVLCERIGKTAREISGGAAADPDFTIPVNIRVTDVNDNAPQFVGAPYMLNISELTQVGAVVFTGIEAVDKDHPGPFSTVEYAVEGEFADHVAFANPLVGSLVLIKGLDHETLKSFDVSLLARDQGSPPQETRTTLTVNVKDADDQNPAFQYPRYEAILPEGGTQGQKLMVQPADLRAFDKDRGLGAPVYYSFTEEYKYFELNRNTGQIYIRSDIPQDEFLQPLTLVVKATQFDNPDRYAVTTLTVSRGGIYNTELQFMQSEYAVRILENVPLNSVVATLLTNKPSDRRVHFFVGEDTLPGGEFTVNQKGEVVLRKRVDFETQERYEFVVHATDGRRNDSAAVNVSLININDWAPKFTYPQYEFFVAAEDTYNGFKIGKLEVHDGDKGEKVSLEITGPHARVFRIDSRGELEVHDLSHLNGSSAHIVVVAEDSGIPPRRDSVPVAVHFAGAISARSRTAGSGVGGFFADNPTVFVVIFAAVLIVLVTIILSLVVYICKHKRKYDRGKRSKIAGGNGDTKIFANYYQRTASDFRRGVGGGSNPVLLRPGSTTGSRRSSSETLSSDDPAPLRPTPVALNPLNPRSGSQRYSKNAMLRAVTTSTPTNRVSPATSTPPPPQNTPSIHTSGLPDLGGRAGSRNNISADPMPNGGGGSTLYAASGGLASSVSSLRSNLSEQSLMQAALRENILRSSERSVIEWPRHSIPRRVKKLSWEDEYSVMGKDRDISTLTDPNVSVTPLSEEQRIEDEVATATSSSNASPHASGSGSGGGVGPQIGQPLYF